MKPFLIFLFTTITPVLIYSQNITVKSFKQLSSDMDARVTFPKTDQNGQKCAIIKVQTTETGFSWDGDMLGIVASEKKVGEYWLYIPRGAKRLTIKHERLGVLRDYPYPESIKEATVYEMVLTTGKVVTTIEDYKPTTQFMVITSIPDGADVFINDQHKGVTPFQQEMTEGEYNYRVVKEFYYTEAGKLTLSAAEGKKEIAISLKPNFGFAEIITKPEDGMGISIDGIPLNKTTPFNTGKIKSGKHKITVNKALYHEQTKEIIILDNQTLKVELDVLPAFGWITINSDPEIGASIILDGNETGKITPCKLERIVSGEHTISLRKDWYEPRILKVLVADGKETNLPVALQPTFGTVRINTDSESEILVDNQSKGRGVWNGRLIAGWHTLEAKKDKHYSASKKVELVIGDIKEITLEPKPIYGNLKVVANAIGAIIKLNGKEYGTTPNLISNLFIGEYSLSIEKQGYGTLTKNITISENVTTELNETLKTGMSINITSEPLGAILTVDGNYIGSTPQNLTLSFGNHAIKLVNGKKVVEENISINQNSRSSFNYSVSEEIQVTFTSNLSKTSFFVDGSYWGAFPKTINLALGNHTVKIEKGNNTIEKTITLTNEGKTKLNFSAQEFIKTFYKKHLFSASLGYHSTNFSNAIFKDNLSNGKIRKGFGYAATMSINLFPIFCDLTYFSSGLITKNIEPFTPNSIIKHRGGEIAFSLVPYTFHTNIYPYFGMGYQYSQIYASSISTGGSASTIISLPIIKAGVKFRIKQFVVFGEYKKAIDIKDTGHASGQIYSGFGWIF